MSAILKKKFFILFKSNRPFIFVENALDITDIGVKRFKMHKLYVFIFSQIPC